MASSVMSARKDISPSLRTVMWLWVAFNFLSFLSILPIPIVNALIPTSAYGTAYETINEDLFIIQGGVYQNATFAANTSQFVALDLTRPSWNVSDPPWVPVNISSTEPLPQRLATSFHSMTVSLDCQSVTIWDSAQPGSVTNYSRLIGAWTSFDVPAELVRSDKELKAAVDPNTGKIYIPLGSEGVNMLINDPAHPNPGAVSLGTGPLKVKAAAVAAEPEATTPAGAGTSTEVTMPPTVRKGATGYSFVWSSYRKSFLFFGGRIGLGKLNDPYFFEYQPANNTWSTMNTNGTVPPRLVNSCMVAAYNGTKMVVFGGHEENDNISKNNIYTLDLSSLEWTKGANADLTQSRSAMACSVSGDNVVVWGGIRRTGQHASNFTVINATPLIYNLHSKQWVLRFERETHYNHLPVSPPRPISPPTPEVTPSSEKSNVGEIVGGTLAVVLVLALVTAYYIAHTQPQLLRQLIRWGNEPNEQPYIHGFSRPIPGQPLPFPGQPLPFPGQPLPFPEPPLPLPEPSLPIHGQPLPINLVNINSENGNRSNGTNDNSNNDQNNTPEQSQNRPQDPVAMSSFQGHEETNIPPSNASATQSQFTSPQHSEDFVSTKTELISGPTVSSMPNTGPPEFVATGTVPAEEPFNKGEPNHSLFTHRNDPSRSSTISSTTTLHSPESPPPVSTGFSSRSPVPTLKPPSQSQAPPSSSHTHHQGSSSSIFHPTMLPSGATQVNPRNNSLFSNIRSNRQVNTWHAPTADFIVSSSASPTSVPQIPPAFAEVSSDQCDASATKAKSTCSSSSTQSPKQRTHIKSDTPSFAPPVPKKPVHLAHMNGMREASRRQNNGDVSNKSMQLSNSNNTKQRYNPKNNPNTTVAMPEDIRTPPKATHHTVGTSIDHQYPPREVAMTSSTFTHRHRQRQDAAASEPYAASLIVRHPRGAPGVVAAPRPDTTHIVDTAAGSPTTTTPRRPQGGYEPARTTVRNPQIARGVGARTALFDDKEPFDAKLGSDRKGLVDGEEPDESKKFQK